ncbi:MAG: TonB-dependent receptor [Endomicrobium sp.]|jgi:hemoglobin/transferrin/lactoferrin receptor protein|nr:TonB-dependent receptor [Endomicrobium sp.]
MKKIFVLFIAIFMNVNIYAQDGTPSENGLQSQDEVIAEPAKTDNDINLSLTGVNSQSAQTDAEGDEIKKTKALVVTATRTERSLKEIPMTVTIITAEDIKKTPVSSVAELIARIPGITLEDNGAAGVLKVKIRGEASKRTLVIIDGIRQNEHAPTTGALPIMISPSDIERIEVIKGPSSVLYGSDAIGGVINIITKKGADKPLSFTQRAIFDSSSKRYDFFLGFSGSYQGFFYNGGFDSVVSDLRDTPEGKLVGTDYKRENYTGKLGYAWDKGEISFGVQRHDNDIKSRSGMGNPPSVVQMDFKRQSYDVNFVLKNITDNFAKLTLSGAQQDIRRYTSSFHRKTEGITITPQTDWVFGNHYVIVGGQYNDDDFENTQLSTKVKTDAGLWDASLYLQDEWNIIEPLVVTLGLRQSWYHSSSGSKSKNLDRLIGSIGAVYALNEEISLRSQFSQGFKTPSIYETMMGSTALIINPDLEPEESNNFDIGTIITLGKLNLDASVFYTKAKNYIAWKQTGPMTMQPQNINEAETYGLELYAGYDICSFTPYVSAGYLNRTYWNAPGSAISKTNKTGSSPFHGSLGVRWQYTIAGFVLFSDIKTVWAAEAETESTTGDITKDDGWNIYNLQLGLQKNAYFVTVDINNIADKKYIKADSSPDFYEPGLHVVLSCGFNF